MPEGWRLTEYAGSGACALGRKPRVRRSGRRIYDPRCWLRYNPTARASLNPPGRWPLSGHSMSRRALGSRVTTVPRDQERLLFILGGSATLGPLPGVERGYSAPQVCRYRVSRTGTSGRCPTSMFRAFGGPLGGAQSRRSGRVHRFGVDSTDPPRPSPRSRSREKAA